jgi:hypothetical protein
MRAAMMLFTHSVNTQEIIRAVRKKKKKEKWRHIRKLVLAEPLQSSVLPLSVKPQLHTLSFCVIIMNTTL